MAKLSFADLKKNLPGSTELRYTVLTKKIKNKEKVSLDSGQNVILEYANKEIKNLFLTGDIDTIQDNYRSQALFVSSGKPYKLSDLFKSPEFGGGKGSGAGAAETAKFESAQCLYAALSFYVAKKAMPFNIKINKSMFKKAFAYCDVTESLDSMTDLDDTWHKSSLLGANELYKKYKGKNDYTFHRGSSAVEKIENKFKEINRQEKAFGDLNKWSPADMYIFTTKGLKLLDSSISKSTSLQDLNKRMIQAYKSKDIIGVSLKKMSDSVTFSENNIDKNKIDVKYTGEQIVAPTKKDMFDSMDVYVNHSKGKIQFRSFGGTSLTGWQGEGKGSTANQGKVSLGPLNYILKNHKVPQLPESKKSATFAKNPNSQYFKEFYNTAKYLKVKGLPKTQKAFEANWKKTTEPWRYSKYLGLLLIERLKKLSPSKRNEVVTDIFLYSASKASFSGPYSKIE